MSRRPSRAVIETRAPAIVETDDAQTALYRALDFFPTEPWASRALGEVIRLVDPLADEIDEPACGQGHMAGPLAETFRVRASDIHDHGYGAVADFLAPSARPLVKATQWVATNPPFKDLAAFVERGLEVSTRGVAMLCRANAVESEGRFALMQRLSLQATFSERVSMRLGYWDPKNTFATTYSVLLWMHPEAEAASPLAEAIAFNRAAGGWHTRLIPQGTKARLWADDDIRRYARLAAAPLFDDAGLG